MKPVVYSKKKSHATNIGWHRAGNNIIYFANRIMKKSKSMYTLRFTYTFDYTNDTVWFAYSYPYTYTQLTEFFNKIEADRTITE